MVQTDRLNAVNIPSLVKGYNGIINESSLART